MKKIIINWKLLILSIIGVLVRIPLNCKLTGNDAFTLSWYAWTLALGDGALINIHPLSWMGLFTLSGYPILTELILAMFIILTGHNIVSSWYLTSAFISIVGTLITYRAVKEISSSESVAFYSTFFFVINPSFALYSLASISARSIFIALFPLFVERAIKINRELSIKNVLYYFLATLLLLFTHRVSLIFVGLFLIHLPLVVIIKLVRVHGYLDKFWSMILRFIQPIVLLLFAIYYYFLTLSIDYFGVNGVDTKIGFADLLHINPKFNSILELIIDQILRQGISVVFIGILFLFIIFKPGLIDNKQKSLVLQILFVMTPIFIITPIAWYVAIIIVFPLSLLAGISMDLLINIKEFEIKRFLIYLPFVFTIGIIYFIPQFKPILVTAVRIHSWIWVLLLLTLLLSNLAYLIIRIKIKRLEISITKIYRFISITILFLLVINTTVYYNSTLTSASISDFPHPYISDEEMEVAEFLSSQNIEGRILTSHFTIGKRLMGLTGLLFYEDDLGGSGLISGYVNSTFVLENSSLKDIMRWWNETYIYETTPSTPRINSLWYRIFSSDIRSDYIYNLFERENTEYLILTNDGNITYGATSSYSVFTATMFESDLYEILLVTEHLTVYKLNL